MEWSINTWVLFYVLAVYLCRPISPPSRKSKFSDCKGKCYKDKILKSSWHKRACQVHRSETILACRVLTSNCEPNFQILQKPFKCLLCSAGCQLWQLGGIFMWDRWEVHRSITILVHRVLTSNLGPNFFKYTTESICQLQVATTGWNFYVGSTRNPGALVFVYCIGFCRMHCILTVIN